MSAAFHWELVAEAERRLKEGQSHRRIAFDLRISKSFVGMLRLGQVAGSEARRKQPARRRANDDDSCSPFNGPKQRCTGCGGKVQMPCHACHIRALFRKGGIPLLLIHAGEGEPLGLDLADDEMRKRYGEAKRMRQAKEALKPEAERGETLRLPDWEGSKGDDKATGDFWIHEEEAPSDEDLAEVTR